jgi:hypothetical protein
MRVDLLTGHARCGTSGMRSHAAGVSGGPGVVGREAASRALIDLVANLAWSERQHVGEAQLSRIRDEAMALLPKVELGDREATRRAMELVSAAGGRAA